MEPTKPPYLLHWNGLVPAVAKSWDWSALGSFPSTNSSGSFASTTSSGFSSDHPGDFLPGDFLLTVLLQWVDGRWAEADEVPGATSRHFGADWRALQSGDPA